MDRMTIGRKISDFLQKNKYVALILGIGLILLLLPPLSGTKEQKQVITENTDNILSVEDQLSQILSYVKGAGKVQVMLSVATGEETLYQTDESHSNNADQSSVKRDTVTITGSERSETGLIRQVNPPVYSGAVVVCQGADNPSVKYAVIEAVSKVTGLGTDKISVLKMK